MDKYSKFSIQLKMSRCPPLCLRAATPVLLVGALLLCGVAPIHGQESESSPDKRLENARVSFREVMQEPDKGIPRDLFDKARCIVITPGLKKAAFIVGGKYGRGFVSCRIDLTWDFCTSRSERESLTRRKAGHVHQEVQSRTDRDLAATD